MREAGGDLDLAQEPLRAKRVGEFWFQHLDRDVALVADVLGEVDRRHTAAAQLTLNAVPIGKGRGEAIKLVVSHSGSLPERLS